MSEEQATQEAEAPPEDERRTMWEQVEDGLRRPDFSSTPLVFSFAMICRQSRELVNDAEDLTKLFDKDPSLESVATIDLTGITSLEQSVLGLALNTLGMFVSGTSREVVKNLLVRVTELNQEAVMTVTEEQHAAADKAYAEIVEEERNELPRRAASSGGGAEGRRHRRTDHA